MTILERKIRVITDDTPTDPRDNDNVTKMVCFHSRYNLGDKHDYNKDDFGSWDELQEAIEEDYDPIIIKPLYLYDHSGLVISTTPFECHWDSGQIGFIFVPKDETFDKLSNEKKVERQKLYENIIQEEVEVYNSYLSGEVYGYQILKGEEIEDSCYGFYGRDFISNGLAEYLIDYLQDILAGID